MAKTKAAPAKKRRSKREKGISKGKKQLFDAIVFSGVGLIEKRGRKKALVIYTSRQDAIKCGVPRKTAEQLFPNVIAGAGDCRENWSLFGGSMSCDNVSCSKTCWVQVIKLDGLGWNNLTDGDAVINSNWAYRCNCN